MSEKKKQIRLWSAVIVTAIILVVVVTWTGCKKKPAEQTQDVSKQTQTDVPHHEHPVSEQFVESPNEPAKTDPQDHGPSVSEQPVESPNEPAKTDPEPAPTPKIGLYDVIKARRYWDPVYSSWYGKTAPDFTLTDITGKQHKLSDYRGKNVLLDFWATWCPYCRMKIPHLIALRNIVSEDKLAILAISNEDPALVKRYVAYQKMNYTVLTEKGDMPPPYGVVRITQTAGIPCSFFINPDGKIKLAATGFLSLSEMKVILQAE